MTGQPVLYSFRRCPYAMRARMALLISGQKVELREVVLRDKPEAMLHQSSKGTVPVLVQTDGQVLDESLDVIYWALDQSDPEGWLTHKPAAQPLIAQSDAEFKYHLDRYKYPNRYDDVDPDYHRAEGLKFLQKLDGMIAAEGQIFGPKPGLADYAIFPFVRQFANHDRGWFDAQDLPALQPWLAGHLGSPIFAVAMEKFPQWQPDQTPAMFGAIGQ